MKIRHCAAIVLAAGSGSRMGSHTKKQYLELGGRPLITYALQVFEDSLVQDVLLVVPEEDIAYCEKEIVGAFGFTKVRAVIAGGEERCHSVAYALRALASDRGSGTLSDLTVQHSGSPEESDSVPDPLSDAGPDLVFIHDGARPFVTQEMLRNLYDAACTHQAAVAAMPVKNTIKKADASGQVVETLDRSVLWEMQTPQVFDFELIHTCYEQFLKEQSLTGGQVHCQIRPFSTVDLPKNLTVYPTPCQTFLPTDDAQLVERYSDVKVQLVKTSYSNLKITTPEDLALAKTLVSTLLS